MAAATPAPQEGSTLRILAYLTLAALSALAAVTAIAQTKDDATGSFEQQNVTSPLPTTARVTSDLMSITLQFNCSAQTSDDAISAAPVIRATAQAMLDADMLKAKFLLAYHTAAGTSDQTDKEQSEFCATAIRRVLIDRYHVGPERLFNIGYGSTRPINGQDKRAPENQRLEITNLGEMASKQ
jgi:outer membrane protein OmpA-like peptidoglycan-associated protein